MRTTFRCVGADSRTERAWASLSAAMGAFRWWIIPRTPAGAQSDRRSDSGTVPGPLRRRFVEDFVELSPLMRTRPEVELPFWE